MVKQFREEDLWRDVPCPRHHKAYKTRSDTWPCFPQQWCRSFSASAPTTTTKVSTTHWSIMLCRHLGLPVYIDSTRHYCQQSLDGYGDHATDMCPSEFGHRHRHDSIWNALAITSSVPLVWILSLRFETSSLVPILGRETFSYTLPAPPLASARNSRLVACDGVITSPFALAAAIAATRVAGSAAA